jgi:hypothetical protein
MAFSFLSGAIQSSNTGFNVPGYILPSEVEKILGNPISNGQVLASNTDGVRYWTSNISFAFTANSANFANSASFLGGRPEANLNVNSAVYSTNASFAYTANNASHLDGKPQANLNVNSAVFSTNASFAYAANNTYHFDGKLPAYYTNATNIIAGTLGEPRLPFRMNQNVTSSSDVEFHNVVLTGSLSVANGVTVITANNVSITDNMIYFNNGILATISNVSGNGTYVTFTANNNFRTGWDVYVTGVDPSSYNQLYHNISFANATHFQVANTNTASYVSGGTARGKTDVNPDLGFAAGYNDGTYHHTGFFRHHLTGTWKVFDSYVPEPDASPYIDQDHPSFRNANFMANTIFVGNNTEFATITPTNFSGTANNASFAYSKTEETLNVNAAVYSTNANFAFTANNTDYLQNRTWNAPAAIGAATSNTGAFTTLTASANVNFDSGTLFIDATTNRVGIGNTSPLSVLDVSSNASRLRITQNVSAIVFNGIDFVSHSGGVNGGLIWNQSTGEVRLNTAVSYFPTFYSNGVEAVRIDTNGNVGIGTTNPGQKLHVNGSVEIVRGLVANGSFGNSGDVLISNGTSIYWSNNSLFANSATYSNNANLLEGNPSSYYTNATNITTGTLQSNTIPSYVVNTSASFTFSNNLTFNANIVIGSTGGIVFNNGAKLYDTTGSQGTAGQVLASNGTGNLYWTSMALIANNENFINTTASFTFTNTAVHTHQANIVLSANAYLIFNSNSGIIANSSSGNTGFILASSGRGVYWTSMALIANNENFINTTASYTFTSTAVHTHNANIVIGSTGGIKFDTGGKFYDYTGSLGTDGQVLTSNGSIPYWKTPSSLIKRTTTYTSSSTFTAILSTTDIAIMSYTAASSTPMTIANANGVPIEGQSLVYRIQSTNPQTLSFGSQFSGSIDLPLPSLLTGSSKYDYLGFIWNDVAQKWQLLAKNFGF